MSFLWIALYWLFAVGCFRMMLQTEGLAAVCFGFGCFFGLVAGVRELNLWLAGRLFSDAEGGYE